jgi:hypothetical protein
MNIKHYNHPVLFYSLATAIPWLFWFTTAYLSHLEAGTPAYASVENLLGAVGLSIPVIIASFMIIGLAAPMITAFAMMFSNDHLKNDLFHRVFRLTAVDPVYIFLACFLMLASILLAQVVSLLFGHSISQFALSSSFSFSAGLLPAWFLLFLAPLLEELAWHSYGTDSLRRRFSLFTTSMIFGVFWALWHFPLSFIKHYYHSNLVETGWIYTLNFSVSLIPYVLLMNWLYYKSKRNILIVIIFHVTAGFFNEIFATHPDSKVIQTLLLLALAVFLIIREPDYFFKRESLEKADDNPMPNAYQLGTKGVF